MIERTKMNLGKESVIDFNYTNQYGHLSIVMIFYL